MSDPLHDEEEEPQGSLRPTTPGAVAVAFLIGLVAGWMLHGVFVRWGVLGLIGWEQVLVLYLIAAILAGTAWATWRTLHVRRQRLDPRQAVNRLVVARASALVGALLAGGYAGYALSWLGSEAALASQRVFRSGLGALAGVLVVTSAIALERACRVRKDED